MAQNNTVELNIATANTSKATKDVKSLKEQIKDLKNEMAGLTKGTEEYNQAAAQLGDLMHTQEEITEAAKLATADYGQTLSNITSISAGAVGSLSALNGVMNLIGENSDDATEAMRKIQSLMAIIAGLNQLDAADKALRGLITRIKASTTAKRADTQETIKNSMAEGENTAATELDTKAKKKNAAASGVATAGNNVLAVSFKNLGRAIKSFMMSNPFTMIILGVTSLIGLIGSLGEEVDDVDNKLSNLKVDRVEELKNKLQDLSGDIGSEVGRDLGKGMLDGLKSSNWDKLLKEALEKGDNSILWKADKEIGNITQKVNDAELALKKAKEELDRIQREGEKTAGEYATAYADMLEKQLTFYEYTAIEAEYEATHRAIVYAHKDGLPLVQEELDKITEDWVNEARDLMNQAYESVYNQSVKIRENTKSNEQKTKDDQARRNRDAVQKRKERQARELSDLKAAYALQEAETKRLYRDQELTEDEYYDRSKKELEAYLEDLRQMKIRHNKDNKLKEKDLTNGLTKEDLVELEKLSDQAVEIERKRVEAMIELNKKLADARNYRPESSRSSVNEARYQNAKNAMTDETGARYIEQQEELYNAWWGRKFRLIQEYNQREIEEERRHNDELNQLAMEKYAEQERVLNENRDGDKAYEEQRFDNEMSYLMQRCEAKLITQEEYNLAVEEQEREHQERLWEIQNEYYTEWQGVQDQKTETLRDIAQQRYEIEAEGFERQRELTKTYLTALSSLVSSVGNLLGSLQGYYEEGDKEYEALQEGQIIMSTITGTLAAWMSGIEAAPAPWNLAIAAAMSGIALAQGIMAIDQLHKKKLGGLSSGASNAPSTSAYQTVAYETGAELQGDIQDQRVFVTETDISDTLTRVNVMETESTF